MAFHSNRGGKFDIWTIRPDGSGLKQLTHVSNGNITHTVRFPDGKRLIYSLPNGTPRTSHSHSESPTSITRGTKPGGYPRVLVPRSLPAENGNQFDDQDNDHEQLQNQAAGFAEFVDHELVKLTGNSQLLVN